MKNNFYDCEKEILEFYLNQEVFMPERNFNVLVNKENMTIDKSHINYHGIELIIRPECNQKCEYCYIARYGDELYPHAERANNEQLLSNLDKLLHYIFIEKNTFHNHFELFAGDLFYDNLYFDILDVFYKYLEPLYKLYPEVFHRNEGLILTPSNFSFIHDEEKEKRVDEYIAKFRKINWDLGFSISTDGKYAIDTREQRPLDDAYFDKLFNFTKKYPRAGFHPIISASNIHNGIKNYEWWKEMYKKYYYDEEQGWCSRNFLPYWLEARNDEWTPEAIQAFCDLLDHMIEDRLNLCDNDIDKFAYHLFKGDGANETLPLMTHSDLIDVRLVYGAAFESIGCSLKGLFCINLGNLTLPPCHRLTYRQFRGGQFVPNENNSFDLVANNVLSYINIVGAPNDALPQCVNCVFSRVCTKGCFGAQFEATGEIFQPAITVCELFKTYFGHLIHTYARLGVFESAHRQNLINDNDCRIYEDMLTAYKEERRARQEQDKKERFY